MVKKNERGITLIALVITIIILIILAGISINLLLGENGIITRSKNAKEQHEYAAAKEIIDLKLAEIYTDAVSNNEEYTMKKITTEMDKDTTITTEQKYFKTTASLKSGVSVSVEDLKGIVVSANQYERFKFLVSGVNGSIQVIGYTTETIPNTWTTGDLPTGFIAITSSDKTGGDEQTTPPGTTSYTVTFKDGETTLSTQTVEEGQTATKPTDPTKEDYDFVNWYSDSELTNLFDFTSTITGNTTIYAKWQQNLAIGDTFNYSTTINGITLSDWKIFHIDGNKIYIIYEDYLPNAAVSTFTGKQTNGTYSVYTNTNRTDLIDAMSTKSNWDSLLTGTLNGTIPVNQTRTENVWAMGAPDLDLWVNSWNASYPSDRLYTNYANPVSGYSYDGWYVGDQANPSTFYINISGKTGYENTLYFPLRDGKDMDGCYGYYLASPSAKTNRAVMHISSNGYVSHSAFNSTDRAFRPVVCLPSDILNQ